MSHKVRDLRGTDTKRSPFRAGTLYPNPIRTLTNYRPRWYWTPEDTSKGFNSSDRLTTIRFARDIFASTPTLHGAVRQKANYSVLDAFVPRYRGDNLKWGKQVENWLKNLFYPVSNVKGGNYTFINTLFALSVALDVDGEALIYLTSSRNGFPQFGVIPSHRIGQRDNSPDQIVAEGRYKGNKIIDGVILSDTNRPIAYRILGDKPEEDFEISAQSALLLFEPDWTDGIRGTSRFAPALIDAVQSQDIDVFLQMQVKLDSTIGLLSWTETGEADPSLASVNVLTADEQPIATPLVNNNQSGVAIEPLMGGMINYMRAGTGEKIEAFKTDRPNANVEHFVQRLERRIMYALAWNYEALNCSALGGASVRMVQNELRNSIRSRQNSLTRAARFIVTYAVALAMKNELIPENYNDEWYNFHFSYGKLLTVDEGKESEADRKDLILGTTTLEQVAAKSGVDWEDLRDQTYKETEDLLARAQTLSKKYGINIDKAIALLSQRSPNDNSAADVQRSTDSTPPNEG